MYGYYLPKIIQHNFVFFEHPSKVKAPYPILGSIFYPRIHIWSFPDVGLNISELDRLKNGVCTNIKSNLYERLEKTPLCDTNEANIWAH